MISSKWVDTLICHTTMCRNSINILYNPGHVTLWCLEVVPLEYSRIVYSLSPRRLHLHIRVIDLALYHSDVDMLTANVTDMALYCCKHDTNLHAQMNHYTNCAAFLGIILLTWMMKTAGLWHRIFPTTH